MQDNSGEPQPSSSAASGALKPMNQLLDLLDRVQASVARLDAGSTPPQSATERFKLAGPPEIRRELAAESDTTPPVLRGLQGWASSPGRR
jgi:hypothetical protein